MNLWLLLPLLLPMLAGLLLLTKPFAEGKIRRLTVQIGLILTLVSLLPAFLTSGRDLTLFTLSDNVEIALHVDGIGMCFCVLMAFVWTAAGFYSFDYMAHEGHEKRFYCLYLLTLGVLMGLCMSGSLVTFYMFYEAMTLLTMPLVMHSGSKEAVAAGIKYLIYSVVGASLVLLGIFAIAPYAQSLSFAPGGALDMAKVAGHEGFVLAIGGVMLLGFGAKAGLYPLHGWLPTAHPAAPSPASAVLSGVITKAGVLGLFARHLLLPRRTEPARNVGADGADGALALDGFHRFAAGVPGAPPQKAAGMVYGQSGELRRVRVEHAASAGAAWRHAARRVPLAGQGRAVHGCGRSHPENGRNAGGCPPRYRQADAGHDVVLRDWKSWADWHSAVSGLFSASGSWRRAALP